MEKKAAIRFIFITALIDILGIGLIIPVVPSIIQELTDFTTSEAAVYGGLLAGSYATMQFIFAPILGALSDQYGRRPLLLISLFGLGIDYIVVALAPTLAWLFIARMISGICGSSLTVANAYIADISTPENRAKNFGMIGAAFGLGFMIGPAIGGLLGEIGSRVPFYAAAGLSLINWLYGYFVIPESLALEDRRAFEWRRANPFGTLKQLLKFDTIRGLVLALFVIYVAAHATHSNWAFFTEEKFGWGPQAIGLSLMFVGVMVSIVQGGVVGPFVKRFGEQTAIFVGLSFNALGLCLMGIISKDWMVYAVIVPYAFGGLAGPALQSIMTGQIPKNAQGELQGGLTSVMMLTSIVGPLIMTNIFRTYTNPANDIYFPGAPFVLATALALVSLLIAQLSLRKHFPRAR